MTTKPINPLALTLRNLANDCNQISQHADSLVEVDHWEHNAATLYLVAKLVDQGTYAHDLALAWIEAASAMVGHAEREVHESRASRRTAPTQPVATPRTISDYLLRTKAAHVASSTAKSSTDDGPSEVESYSLLPMPEWFTLLGAITNAAHARVSFNGSSGL